MVVPDNRAAEEMIPVLQGFAELTAAVEADAIVTLPARDVLPFQNLSPHPEIQEERAAALWQIASGRASIVVAPVMSSATKLRVPEYYIDLARTVRRGDTLDIEDLLGRLNLVGYSTSDVVEMPGQYALRGGILDVYSPEADRPLRIEFFGDEVESIRKFDPATQRSSTGVDEALLLPLTETPVSEDLLGAIHTRLSGRRISGTEEVVEQAVRAEGVTVFPGWEFYAPVAGADRSLIDLLPRAAVIIDEPDAVKHELDRVWSRISEAHERSGIGNLVRPEDLYFPPEALQEKLAGTHGADLEHLGITRAGAAEPATFLSQPTPRFHGSVPTMLEEVQKLSADGKRVLFAAANIGELERLAGEYLVWRRLPGEYGSETPMVDGRDFFVDELMDDYRGKLVEPESMPAPPKRPPEPLSIDLAYVYAARNCNPSESRLVALICSEL